MSQLDFLSWATITFGNGAINTVDVKTLLLDWFSTNIKGEFCLFKKTIYQFLVNQYGYTVRQNTFNVGLGRTVIQMGLQNRITFYTRRDLIINATIACTSKDMKEVYLFLVSKLKTNPRTLACKRKLDELTQSVLTDCYALIREVTETRINQIQQNSLSQQTELIQRSNRNQQINQNQQDSRNQQASQNQGVNLSQQTNSRQQK